MYWFTVWRSRSFFDRLRLQVLFFPGFGSFSYKNRLKSRKNNVFAFTSSHRLRPKSTGSATLLVHVLERILDKSQSVLKNTNFCSLLPGAGVKIPGAVPKQAGSETLVFRIRIRFIRFRIQVKYINEGNYVEFIENRSQPYRIEFYQKGKTKIEIYCRVPFLL